MGKTPAEPDAKGLVRAAWRLRFLYVGTDDAGRDAKWYVERAGARLVWDVKAFGAQVAALDVGPGPQLLLADHRDAGTVLPVYQVDDLKATVATIAKAGWKVAAEPFEIPNGPCALFRDPSGNEMALFQDVRPDAHEHLASG
jgi:hypothetical protein